MNHQNIDKIMELTIKSEEELGKVAEIILRHTTWKTLVLAKGDLGSGKTSLAKQLAQKLGLNPLNIKSPTYTIIQQYPLAQNRTFFHLDLYRLQSQNSTLKAELEEIFTHENFLAFIEWPTPELSQLGNLQLIEISLKIDKETTNDPAENPSRLVTIIFRSTT